MAIETYYLSSESDGMANEVIVYVLPERRYCVFWTAIQ